SLPAADSPREPAWHTPVRRWTSSSQSLNLVSTRSGVLGSGGRDTVRVHSRSGGRICTRDSRYGEENFRIRAARTAHLRGPHLRLPDERSRFRATLRAPRGLGLSAC